MAKKTVTLYIDDGSLRLLVVRGKQVKQWADASLPPGLVKNGVVTSEEEVAEKIKLLFKALKLRAGKVIVGISGLNCLSRPVTFPQLPEDMLDEAVRREAKATLPVPPEKLYLSWKPMPAPPGKTRVFLVAIPRHIADPLQKTLIRAGLKPHLLDVKPLALARAARESTAIVVDVQPKEFDIVIVADGIIHPVRSLSLSSEDSSWDEKLEQVTADVNRTIEFYNANNPDNLLLPTVPVLVSGELAGREELQQTLSAGIRRPVLPLPPPLACPTAGLDPAYYLPNMGLALKDIPGQSGTVTNVNALPEPYRTKPISPVNVLGVPAAVVATGLLVFLVLLIQAASSDISAIEEKLAGTTLLLEQKQAQRQELNDRLVHLEQEIAGAEASGSRFTAAFSSLEGQRTGINAMNTTVDHLPDSIKLTRINYTAGLFAIDGRSAGEAALLAYLKDLEATGDFTEITIISLTKSGDQNADFSLVLRTGD